MSAASILFEPATHEGLVVAGKFRLERVLGEGGMGIVYAAVHLGLLKHVAVKIIRDELVAREDIVEQMLQEARTAAKLSSEHVVHVLDVGRLDNGAPYIVMDYLDGCDLAAHLAEAGRLPMEETVSYVLQACEAVAEAHAAGIVHRDIKPENLFLTARPDGEAMIKVLDFGISRNLAADGQTVGQATIVGSPDYMSPEAMIGEGVGPATDIWSLGAVLYELLSGCRPFAADTLTSTCARVLSEEPVRLKLLVPGLCDAIEAIVMRCLCKDITLRFGSVGELAQALAPYGPEGSLDFAGRIARIASGGRWAGRRTPVSSPPPGLVAHVRPCDSTFPSSVTLPSYLQSRSPFFARRRRAAGFGAALGLLLCAVVGAGTALAMSRSSVAGAPGAAVLSVAALPVGAVVSHAGPSAQLVLSQPAPLASTQRTITPRATERARQSALSQRLREHAAAKARAAQPEPKLAAPVAAAVATTPITTQSAEPVPRPSPDSI